MEVTGGRKSQI